MSCVCTYVCILVFVSVWVSYMLHLWRCVSVCVSYSSNLSVHLFKTQIRFINNRAGQYYLFIINIEVYG